MKKVITCALIVVFSHFAMVGQSFELSDILFNDIDGTPYSSTFTGSLVAPQFSQLDLNFDSKLDLFVFDRSNNEVYIFMNEGIGNEIKYVYTREYNSIFPKMISWTLIRDYNFDGIPDIFTSSANIGISSITVWTGFDDDGLLGFKQKEFDLRLGNVLHHKRSDGKFYEIYVSNSDLPAIYDVDGDGDLDVLNFEIGGSVLNYYRNLVIENALPKDTLLFDLGEFCFGGLSEDPFTSEILLSAEPDLCTFNFGDQVLPRHAGSSSVTAFDYDGDADTDLLIGDELLNTIVFLTNEKTDGIDWMKSQDINFPSESTPANINFFLSSYILDVNADGLQDIIICPNTSGGRQNKDHIWLYLNEGSKTAPVYNLVTKNFLHENHLTFHSGSHPAFADVDGDGLLDLVVGTNGKEDFDKIRVNSIYYLKNIGSINKPMYQLEDQDFLDYSDFGENSGRFAPHFSDIDGDGDKDLFVGDKAGFLYFQENTAGVGVAMNFDFPEYQYKSIFIGSNAKPILHDFDKDGLLDLIIGDQNNELNYIRNIGTATNADFDLSNGENTKELGMFFPFNEDASKSGSPFVVQNGSRTYLYFGQKSGDIRRFEILSTDPTESFIEKILDTDFYIGKNATIALADIDNDMMYEMAVGNDQGGLYLFETNIFIDERTSNDNNRLDGFSISPNPVYHTTIVSLPDQNLWNYEIYDIQGRAIKRGQLTNQSSLDCSEILSGNYLMIMSHGNKRGTLMINITK